MIKVSYGRKWTRAAATTITLLLAALGFATLCILFTPVANWMSYPLRVESPPAAADVIVVLGGGTLPDGTLSDTSLRRVWYGVRLYKEGFAPSLLFSTGTTAGKISEAHAMAQAAIVMGVPPKNVLIEEQSTRTFENAVAVTGMLKSGNTKSILLVTHPTHMARAIASFRKAGIAARPTATDIDEMAARQPMSRALLFAKVAYEYLAWILYWWRGWV